MVDFPKRMWRDMDVKLATMAGYTQVIPSVIFSINAQALRQKKKKKKLPVGYL